MCVCVCGGGGGGGGVCGWVRGGGGGVHACMHVSETKQCAVIILICVCVCGFQMVVV